MDIIKNFDFESRNERNEKIRERVNSRFYQLRKNNNLTIKEMQHMIQEKTMCSGETIGRLELGEYRGSVDLLVAYYEIFGVNPLWLLDESDDYFMPSISEEDLGLKGSALGNLHILKDQKKLLLDQEVKLRNMINQLKFQINQKQIEFKCNHNEKDKKVFSDEINRIMNKLIEIEEDYNRIYEQVKFVKRITSLLNFWLNLPMFDMKSGKISINDDLCKKFNDVYLAIFSTANNEYNLDETTEINGLFSIEDKTRLNENNILSILEDIKKAYLNYSDARIMDDITPEEIHARDEGFHRENEAVGSLERYEEEKYYMELFTAQYLYDSEANEDKKAQIAKNIKKLYGITVKTDTDKYN